MTKGRISHITFHHRGNAYEKSEYSFKMCSNPLCPTYEDVIAPILVTGVNLTLFFVFISVNLLAAAIQGYTMGLKICAVDVDLQKCLISIEHSFNTYVQFFLKLRIKVFLNIYFLKADLFFGSSPYIFYFMFCSSIHSNYLLEVNFMFDIWTNINKYLHKEMNQL